MPITTACQTPIPSPPQLSREDAFSITNNDSESTNTPVQLAQTAVSQESAPKPSQETMREAHAALQEEMKRNAERRAKIEENVMRMREKQLQAWAKRMTDEMAKILGAYDSDKKGWDVHKIYNRDQLVELSNEAGEQVLIAEGMCPTLPSLLRYRVKIQEEYAEQVATADAAQRVCGHLADNMNTLTECLKFVTTEQAMYKATDLYAKYLKEIGRLSVALRRTFVLMAVQARIDELEQGLLMADYVQRVVAAYEPGEDSDNSNASGSTEDEEAEESDVSSD